MPVHAFNAGIMGGSDTEFFKSYSAKAFEFVDKNVTHLPKINVSNFNIFFEQYLFYCLAKKEGKKVEVLIPEIIFDNRYRGFGDFVEVPHNKKYLHLIGDYKRNKAVCEQLANRLREDYPEYYYRIIALFKRDRIPLFRDYFWMESDLTEQKLISRNAFLKKSFTEDTLPISEVAGNRVVKNKELVCFRTPIVKSSITDYKISALEADAQIKDLQQFEEGLWAIVENKFSTISREYLYARDISSTQYGEYVFGKPELIFQKAIVADNLCKQKKRRK